MEQDIEELKRLFYTDRLTQYGKRKLIEYYEKQIKELEEENKKYIVQLTDEQYRKLVDNIRNDVNKEWKSLVKEKIKELKQYKLSLLKENYVEKQKEFKSQNVLVCNAIRDIAATGKIDILQELLEKRK